jgi:hypothetical protein
MSYDIMVETTFSDGDLLTRAKGLHSKFLEVMHPYFGYAFLPPSVRIRTQLLMNKGEIRNRGGKFLIVLSEFYSGAGGVEDFNYTVAHESAHYLHLLNGDVRVQRRLTKRELQDVLDRGYGGGLIERTRQEKIWAQEEGRRDYRELIADFGTLVYFEKERGLRFARRMGREQTDSYIAKRVFDSLPSVLEREQFLRLLVKKSS